MILLLQENVHRHEKMQNFPFASSTSTAQPDIFEINVCDFYDFIQKRKKSINNSIHRSKFSSFFRPYFQFHII